jgi:hypothetical protein
MNGRNVSYYRPMGATNRKKTESGLTRRNTKGSVEELRRTVHRILQNTNRFCVWRERDYIALSVGPN